MCTLCAAGDLERNDASEKVVVINLSGILRVETSYKTFAFYCFKHCVFLSGLISFLWVKRTEYVLRGGVINMWRGR